MYGDEWKAGLGEAGEETPVDSESETKVGAAGTAEETTAAVGCLEARRQAAIERLKDAIRRQLAGESPEKTKSEELLWDVLRLYQDYPFVTKKNLEYTYQIRGYEIFFSRKDKSITRSTVNLAFGTAMELMKEGQPISGPKKLKAFGVSYLYPIFIEIGVIPLDKTKKRKRGPARSNRVSQIP